MNWLDHPAIQGGVVPLIIALVLAAVLGSTQRFGRTPVVWLVIVAAYAATTQLATGLALTPLTATRKVVLISLLAGLVGLALDVLHRRSLRMAAALVAAAAAASIWAFWSIVVQHDAVQAIALAVGIGAFAAASLGLLLRIAGDGIRTAAAGVGLGVATGVSAVMSASVGYLLAGMSIGAACGALLLVQVLARREASAGFTGALAVALPCALFALACTLLAEMPWFDLPLLLLVPLVLGLIQLPRLARMARASVLLGLSLVVALIPIAAAWYAARNSLT